jgi:hypothetical protein
MTASPSAQTWRRRARAAFTGVECHLVDTVTVGDWVEKFARYWCVEGNKGAEKFNPHVFKLFEVCTYAMCEHFDLHRI